MNVQGRELVYKQVENSFTQPNAAINEQMLGWALDVTKGSEGDLLELYCGNGNFSIALAQNFRKVLATEIAAERGLRPVQHRRQRRRQPDHPAHVSRGVHHGDAR